MDIRILYSRHLCCIKESLQMCDVAVHAAITDQTEEMQAAMTPGSLKRLKESWIGMEGSALNLFVDRHYSLKEERAERCAQIVFQRVSVYYVTWSCANIAYLSVVAVLHCIFNYWKVQVQNIEFYLHLYDFKIFNVYMHIFVHIYTYMYANMYVHSLPSVPLSPQVTISCIMDGVKLRCESFTKWQSLYTNTHTKYHTTLC